MLRKLLLYLSNAAWARQMVTHWGVARRVARRFIAGETIDDALQASRELNRRGLLVSLDYLGESVNQAEDTVEVVETYRRLLDRIADEGLKASVSLKLTHLGLDISEELCQTNLRHILTEAQTRHIPVTIDMESSHYTETTLRIFRTMLHEYDFKNVGAVIQAYLRRTPSDMQQLSAEGARVRLCKGAYLEPPDVALPDKADVDAQYVQVMKSYLSAPPPAYLEIATHDERIIQQAQEMVKDLPQDRYEFQMLYGVRDTRQVELASAGYQVRAYVPFGEAWYPYFMRRLAERPANLWFFLRSFVRR